MNERKSNVRWMFALMFFVIGVIAYMDRANISYIAGPMMEDLNMSKAQFGMLGSIFAAGYALMQVPAGIMAEKFGPKKLLTFALIWWSAFTILTGVVRNHGLLYTMRFLFGIGEGPMYPSNAVFNTYWFAKSEKGRASSALLAGSYFGPVIAPFVTIAIYQAFGWEAVFYIFGAIGILIALLWAVIAKDLPEQHKMVNEAEKHYIMENRDAVGGATKETAPWGRFFQRFSFFAIAGQYFVVQFVITLFLIWLPTYLQEEYHVILKDMKFLAAAPWLMMFVLIMAGGSISDAIVARGHSKFKARSSIAIFGFIVFAISLFLSVQTNDMTMNIIYLSLCLGGVGLSMGMSWASAADLGRNFSGTVSGWMNLWGNIGAFLSPFLGGVLVQKFGWDTTFYLMLIPAALAIILWFFVKPDEPLLEEHRQA